MQPNEEPRRSRTTPRSPKAKIARRHHALSLSLDWKATRRNDEVLRGNQCQLVCRLICARVGNDNRDRANAWVAARVPWEQSEGFLFGPVDTFGYDPAMDSWPVNRTDLDAVLASGQAFTPEYIPEP